MKGRNYVRGDSSIGVEVPYLGTFIAKLSAEYTNGNEYDMIPCHFFSSETGIHKQIPELVN